MSDTIKELKNKTGYQRISGDIQKIAPFATTYITPDMRDKSRVSIPQQEYQSTDFLSKFRDVATQTGSLIASGAQWLGGYISGTFSDIASDAQLSGKTIYDTVTMPGQLKAYEEAVGRLSEQQDKLIASYKSGKLSKKDYIEKLDDLSEAYNKLSSENENLYKGPTPEERAEAILMTGITVLSVGSLRLGAGVGKTVVNSVLNKELSVASNVLEKQFLRNGAFRSLIVRNAQKVAKVNGSGSISEYVLRNAKDIAVNLLVKRPLVYQMNLADAKTGLDAIMNSDPLGAVKSAAWLGVQLLNGGPLGAASRGFKWLSSQTKMLAYGKGSAIDALSRQIGNGDSIQIAKYLEGLAKKNPEKFKEAEKALKIMQNQQTKLFADDADEWARGVIDYMGMEKARITPQEVIENAIRHRQAEEIASAEIKRLVSSGKLNEEEASRWAVVRWLQADRDFIADMFDTNSDVRQAYSSAVSWLENRGLSGNKSLMSNIDKIVSENIDDGAEIAKKIRNIDAASFPVQAIEKTVANKIQKLGYIVARPEHGRSVSYIDDATDLPRLVSEATNGKLNLFDPAVVPQPNVSFIASLLNKSGLSPEAASTKGQVLLAESVAERLSNSGILKELGGKDNITSTQGLLTTLQTYIEKKIPNFLGRAITLGAADKSAITDLRQLRTDEIVEALAQAGFRVSNKRAKDIQRSIVNGYLDVPLSVRGLGDRIVDTLYKINPLQKHYSRVQSALRYTYNPFFRIQEKVETSILAGAVGGNKIKNLVHHNGIWNRSTKELDEVVNELDNSGMLSSSLYGEAAQDQVLGRITANITKGQKRDLAGLALDIARSKGLDGAAGVKQLIRTNPDEIGDALRIIVQYPKEGILASPLARTLNIAFFPMRYNAKVTMLAGQVLAKQPPVIQKAVLHGVFQLSDWLKSDEGIRWQREYADALQVFNWVTPVGSLTYMFKLLTGGASGIGDLGALGGLPLGVISQVLDSQGIIDINAPYVNPKTGDVIPKYIPESAKARAATAMIDLLGSTFTYPGRTLGLPGKGESLRKLVKNFIATSAGEFNIDDELDGLTPMQLNMIRVLKGDTSDEAINALYNSVDTTSDGAFKGFTTPPANFNDLFPQLIAGIPKKKKTVKTKKVARPMPN